tara:strand:- start:2877 stop:3947 length:1071 start_codon:yes stop_codon:yes gene_type:complete
MYRYCRPQTESKIMHVGKRVGTVFSIGARVVRADVIVSQVDAQRRTVHVIAQDGEEYGPIAIPKLKEPRFIEFVESHAALLEAWVTNRVEDYAARRITEAIRRAERVYTEEELFGVDDEHPAPTFHDAVVQYQEENPAPTYQDAAVQYQEEYHHECNYCGTTVDSDSSSAPPCGTILCADCTTNYVSTLFDHPPTGVGVPCPCDCGATLTWSHVARSVPDDVMTRLVRLYTPAPPPPDPPPSLGSLVRRTFEEASNLCAPCCGAVIDDFDNCFSVTCRACTPTTYFCGWCLRYTSSSTDECHAHVRDCDENPHPGAVYGDMTYWLDVHRTRKRKRSLKDAYFRACNVIAEAHNALL